MDIPENGIWVRFPAKEYTVSDLDGVGFYLSHAEWLGTSFGAKTNRVRFSGGRLKEYTTVIVVISY